MKTKTMLLALVAFVAAACSETGTDKSVLSVGMEYGALHRLTT